MITTGSKFSKRIGWMLAIAVGLAVLSSTAGAADPNYPNEDPCALEVYNRVQAWDVDTHTVGENSHSHWSYYYQLMADRDATGRGDTGTWQPMPRLTVNRYQFLEALPTYGAFQAYGGDHANGHHLTTEWNVQSGGERTYENGELIVAFTAPEDGTYNVVGRLKWSCEHAADCRAYVRIGTMAAGSGTVNLLYESPMLRDGDNLSPYVNISPLDPCDVPDYETTPTLQGIQLATGDQILMFIQNGLNYRKVNVHDSGMMIERVPEAPTIYNRAAAWSLDTHTDGQPDHGNWAYYNLTQADRDVYGRGDDAYWTPIPYRAAQDDHLVQYPQPDYGEFQVLDDRMKCMWNKGDAIEPYVYREADLLSVFTVPEDGTYSLAGELKWSNYGANDTRATVIIGTIPGGTTTFNALWTSVLLRDADNLSPFDMIPETSPIDVPGYADNTALQNLPLNAGDRIVIASMMGVLNYRGFQLHDGGMNIEALPADATMLDFNRTADWGVSLKGGNAHGTFADPAGTDWSYWIKPQALDRLDWLPTELEMLPWDVADGQFDREGPVFWARAQSDRFDIYWNRYPDGGVNYNELGTEPWVVALFKNPYPGTVLYNITGETTWEKLNVSDVNGQGIRFEIAKVDADMVSKTVLWGYDAVNGAIDTFPVPDPSLSAIDLAEGEYLAVAMRGCRINHRRAIWHNSALTISADASSFKTLTVTADPVLVDGGIAPVLGESLYLTDQVVTISADDYAGACPTAWMFDHWEVDDAFYSSDATTTLTMDANKALKAVFVESNVCGDVCRPYPTSDLNQDCRVDLADFADMSAEWGDCTSPACD